jgi:hypothetical protein
LERAKLPEETVRTLRGEGKGVREIAAALNQGGIPAPRGGKWHSASVHRLVVRLDERADKGRVVALGCSEPEGSTIAPAA